MKRFLFALLLLMSSPLLAQVKLPVGETGQVQFQDLVRLSDKTRPARQVLQQSQRWAASYFSLDNRPELHEDREHGILFIKAIYPLGEQTVRFAMTIETKMGRYRATITDLIADGNGLSTPIRPVSATAAEMQAAAGSQATNPAVVEQAAKQQADLYQTIDETCRATLASLKAALTNP